MADNNTIARPYAQAAFEVANETGALATWSQALADAKALFEDGQVAKFLGNPALSDKDRLAFLRDLFKSGDAASTLLSGGDLKGSNFIRLLLEYDRIAVLPEIADHFEVLKAQIENTVDVTVTSAAAISDAQRQAIAAALKTRLGRDVRIEVEIDEDLIGGAVIRAGDVVIDGSLRSRLESLSNALIA